MEKKLNFTMDQKLMKYIIILVGIIVALIIVMLLVNFVTGGRKYEPEDLEAKIVAAAKKYVEDKKKANQDVLPDAPGGTPLELGDDLLVNNGYIDELSDLVKGDDVICHGRVYVWNAGNGNYDYVPEIICGTYTTKRLVDKVIEDGDYGITYGSGLYVRKNGEFVTDDRYLDGNGENFEYVFRGDEVNNYVKIDDNIFRIVAIDDQDNMLLILELSSRKSFVWDEKFNSDTGKNQGINMYEENGLESNAYKLVREYYDGTLELINKEKKSKKINHLLVPMDLCSGKRSINDSSKDGSTECKTKLEGEYVGLLPAYYYMSASLDSGCDSITSKNCGNYNYLSGFDDYWWLLTANADNTSEAYAVARKFVSTNFCSFKSVIRPIMKIGSRVLYKEGKGTIEEPYEIKYFTDDD